MNFNLTYNIIFITYRGGHPYLTALSIAGGIFYFGLEGALIGPMLLACLLVAIALFSKLMQGTTTMTETPVVNPKRIRWALRRYACCAFCGSLLVRLIISPVISARYVNIMDFITK